MTDSLPRGPWPETFKRWWLWPLGVLIVLLVVAATLVLVAQAIYNKDEAGGFASVLATGVLLNGAVVVTLGAIVTTVLSIAAEIRSRRERAADKRLELFRRMRDAHVRVALIRQILLAQRDTATYHKQMRALQPVIKDMQEIHEEVRVSGRLYDHGDRRLIVKGIAQLIMYLQEGVSQYVTWCTPADGRTPDTRPDKEGSWIVVLVADHDAGRTTDDPGNKDWEPKGHMPADYNERLDQSKLIMRAYVYAQSRKARAELRKEDQRRTAARRAAEVKVELT